MAIDVGAWMGGKRISASVGQTAVVEATHDDAETSVQRLAVATNA